MVYGDEKRRATLVVVAILLFEIMRVMCARVERADILPIGDRR